MVAFWHCTNLFCVLVLLVLEVKESFVYKERAGAVLKISWNHIRNINESNEYFLYKRLTFSKALRGLCTLQQKTVASL